ncbi:hypothetical protein ACLOJK_001548 [Asimina triloba]
MTALVIGIGFYVDSIRRVTRWLPDNINQARIDNVYWAMAVVWVVNFGYFLLCAKLYDPAFYAQGLIQRPASLAAASDGGKKRPAAMASSAGSNLLVINGLPCQPQDVPSVTTLLQSRDGAYTTTRTHSSLSNILFWDRHLQRLADSARLLAQYKPAWFSSQTTRTALLSTSSSYWDSEIRPLIASSLRAGFQTAFEARAGGGETANAEEELAITTLICGYGGPSDGLDVFVHFGIYAPPMFGRKKNGARLAVIGLGRDLAMAKLSEWVRKRKSLENLRPPLATELLLSNDGEKILEGSVTNFFVVCQRVSSFKPSVL